MKNWKRILCIAMAAMLACPSVSVYASGQEYMPEVEKTEEEALETETEENTEISEVVEETEVTETGLEETTEESEMMQRTANAVQPENPVYNENTESTKWSYVYFGSYPQSEVAGDELDSSIINANYNVNGDAVVDGVKYRRVQDEENSTVRYYRYEPIKWKVVQNDGSSLWLMSAAILFEHEGNIGPGYQYSNSTLRSRLNAYDAGENINHIDYSEKGSNFYTVAFNEGERDIIVPMTFESAGVTDLVSIPDYYDLENEQLGYGSDYSRAVYKTDYSSQNDDEMWASQIRDEFGMFYIDGYEAGSTGVYGFWSFGVCPQIKISLDSDFWSMDCPEASFDAQSIEENSVSVTLAKKSYVYDGTAKTPKVKVKDGSETLIEGVDYTVTYLNNTQAGTTAAVRLDGTGDYIGSRTVYFTIEKADQEISVTKNITKKTNDKKFKLGAKLTTGNGALTYQSDKTSVAKIDRYGNITICGGGTANITVTAKATTNYNAATAKVVLKVEKIKPSLTVTKTKFTKAYGDKAFEIDAETEEDVEILFASSDKKVVTVNADGKVSIKGCGVANITVKTVEDEEYASVKKTVKITVKPKKNSFTQAVSKKKGQAVLKWKKDSMASGYEIVYTYNGKSKKVDVRKNSTVSTTLKSLKSKKTYSVKIRSYKEVNGEKIYGDYSKAKKITIK